MGPVEGTSRFALVMFALRTYSFAPPPYMKSWIRPILDYHSNDMSYNYCVQVHIEEMLKMDRIAELWAKHHGKPSSQKDVDRMYNNFLPEQINALGTHAHVISGKKIRVITEP